MESIHLTEKQQHLIEKMGVFFERSGLPPAQARIIALLMIADRTELTFDEIRNTLQLSKSATSSAINALLLTHRIVYTTKLGDRKRYFSSKIGSMEEDFEKKFGEILELKTIFMEVLENRTPETVEFNERLKRIIDFMTYIQEELPGLYERWKARRK